MHTIVCISDTHNRHDKIVVPDGDLLLFAGDATGRGTVPEIAAFLSWIEKLPHKNKVVIAGNHDWLFHSNPIVAKDLLKRLAPSIHYLEDSSITLDGLKIYGSPWSPEFCSWAFNLDRGKELRSKWAAIPTDTDILITHTPPKGVLDLVQDEEVGCEELRAWFNKAVTPPKLHVFGHIHECPGVTQLRHTMFVNAAICTPEYQPINKPVIIRL